MNHIPYKKFFEISVNDQRKYAGSMQNDIQSKTGFFGSATDKGQVLFYKLDAKSSLENLGLKIQPYKGLIMVDVSVYNLKKLELY